MSDFAAFCPVVNRFDLLRNVLDACTRADTVLNIVNNSGGELPAGGNIFDPPVPLTFSQSMNFEFYGAEVGGMKFFLHMHSDAIIPDGAIEKLVAATRLVISQKRKWGVIYTHYDILAAYNPEACRDIGGYDTTFPAYFSDNDWYHRLDLAGYERIDTGIEVGHVGSQTINSDPYLRNLNSITFPLYRQIYVAKWGGEPGKERFKVPYNNFNTNRIQVIS